MLPDRHFDLPDNSEELKSLEVEEKFLGGLLSDWVNFEYYSSQMSENIFTYSWHKTIFLCMATLFANQGSYEVVTVIDYLKSDPGINQTKKDSITREITNLYTAYCGSDLSSLLAVLTDYRFRRELLVAGQEIYKLGSSEFKSLSQDTIKQKLGEQVDNILASGGSHDLQLVASTTDRILNFVKTGKSKGITTGFPTLDRLIGGFKPGKVYVIGARTAMGKTNVSVHYALTIIKNHPEGYPVLFLSAEMSLENLAIRFIANLSGVNSSFIANDYMTYEERDRFEEGVKKYQFLKLIIDESPAQSINERTIGEKLRTIVKNYGGVGAVIIDYIQLLGSFTINRRDLAIGEVIRACKDLAKQYKIPFVVLAQVRREVEQRQNKRPNLSDLKDSGVLEQASDSVIFVYRDEYYNQYTELPGITELIVAKNRDGATGSIALKHDLGTCKYIETKIS